jgi:hypothetical protein
MVSGRSDVQPNIAGIDEAAVRAQVEAICGSPTFRRSEQSQRFLRYICDLALRGDGARINEYLIGQEVFNRGDDYSTAEDAIVRRQAHTLRRKLDSYYANEGRGDRIRIELPVGHYEPAFRIDTGESPPRSALPTPHDDRPVLPRRKVIFLSGVLLLAAALIGSGWLLGRSSASASLDPERMSDAVKEIWGAWLADPAGVTICFPNSNVALVHLVRDETAKDSHPHHFRPAPDAEDTLRKFFRMPDGGFLFYRPSDTKTGIAESISGVYLAELFGRWHRPVHATQSQLVNWQLLRNGNYVILGHNEANPWVDKLLHKYPLRLGDSEGIQRYIENRAPLEGERARYAKEAPNSSVNPTIEYALVSMIPGFSDSQRLLLISGLDGQATLMATEYLTQETKLRGLIERLHNASPSHSGPWYFQFIVRAEVHDRLATRAEIVSFRLLEDAR